MRDLITSTIKLGTDPGDPISGVPLTVRARAGEEGRAEVTVQVGYSSPLRLDWSEADALASMLSDAANAVFEEVI